MHWESVCISHSFYWCMQKHKHVHSQQQHDLEIFGYTKIYVKLDLDGGKLGQGSAIGLNLREEFDPH